MPNASVQMKFCSLASLSKTSYFLLSKQITSIACPPYPSLGSQQSNLNPPSVARARITSSLILIYRDNSTGSHQQTRGQVDRSPRAHVVRFDQINPPCSRDRSLW